MRSFIFVNYQGNRLDYDRFINSGIVLWRYLHQKLSQNLYEIKEFGELKNDTMNVWYKNLSNGDIKITTHSKYETLIEKFRTI